MTLATETPQPLSSSHSPHTNYGFRQRWFTYPWWFIILVGLWVFVLTRIFTNPESTLIFNELIPGIGMTLLLAFTSYIIAVVLGLGLGIIRANPPKPLERTASWRQVLRMTVQTLVYNLATFYVEFIRGIPALVFLLIAGFVIVPEIRNVVNNSLIPWLEGFGIQADGLQWRGNSPATAIAGLSLIYAAFLAEVFRGGIQGVAKGQIEAARSLGMTTPQVLRFIVIPQAIRAILPPLGNDFIAMIKDTSLVTILGINEITQLARKWASSSFQYLETYLVLSLIYLTLTVIGSVMVQAMERRLKTAER